MNLCVKPFMRARAPYIYIYIKYVKTSRKIERCYLLDHMYEVHQNGTRCVN